MNGLNRTEAELLNYSDVHLTYEIQMFFGSGIQLLRNFYDESDEASFIIYNALLESYVTHLRNLINFIYPANADENDVISNEYFEDIIEDWQKYRPKLSRSLEGARTRASREIAHLTIFRRDDDDSSKRWKILQLMKEIQALLGTFISNASPARLHVSVKNAVNSIDLTKISQTVTDPSSKSIKVGGYSATNQIKGTK